MMTAGAKELKGQAKIPTVYIYHTKKALLTPLQVVMLCQHQPCITTYLAKQNCAIRLAGINNHLRKNV